MGVANGAGSLYHSQFFYKDGSNSGFFPKDGNSIYDEGEARPDKGHTKDEYDFSRFPKEYDDELLKKAEEIVKKENHPYSLPVYNCHDYAKDVNKAYDDLVIKLTGGK